MRRKVNISNTEYDAWDSFGLLYHVSRKENNCVCCVNELLHLHTSCLLLLLIILLRMFALCARNIVH